MKQIICHLFDICPLIASFWTTVKGAAKIMVSRDDLIIQTVKYMIRTSLSVVSNDMLRYLFVLILYYSGKKIESGTSVP